MRLIEGEVEILPVIRMKPQSLEALKFEFRNNSSETFVYCLGYPFGIAGLNIELIDPAGQSLLYGVNWDGDLPVDLQMLDPGRTLKFPIRFSLEDFAQHGYDLSLPRQYQVRMKSNVLSRPGVTPFEIDCDVAILNVADDAPPRDTGGMGLLLIALTTFAIAEGMALVYGFKFLWTRRMHERASQE